VGLIVWSAAEISVTMICIGIPVCRPLYKSFLEGLVIQPSDYQRAGSGERQFARYTFGGSSMNAKSINMGAIGQTDCDPTGGQGASYADQFSGLRQAPSRAFSMSAGVGNRDDASDEEILNHAYRGDQQDSDDADTLGRSIKVTEEFCVTSRSRC
jgi:hypothetical protein